MGSNLESAVDVNDLGDMEGNKAVVSKLLSCNYPLVLRDKDITSMEVARERFKSAVMPFINEDKVVAAVLAIYDIISKDVTIVTEHKESFKKCLGLYRDDLLVQTKWDVPDFMTRILLYTTCVDNRMGTRKTEGEDKEKEKPDVAKIVDSAIKETRNSDWMKYEWDTNTKILKMMPTAEKRIWDRVRDLSGLRTAMMNEEIELGRMFADTSWLNIDESELFHSSYRPKIMNPETRRRIMDKAGQVAKLLAELRDCLVSPGSSTAKWPVSPSERVRNLVEQIETLCDDISLLTVMDGFSHQT